MPEETDLPLNSEQEILLTVEQRKFLPPDYLRPFFPWRDEPESEKLPLVESAFTSEGEVEASFGRLAATKEAILIENQRRKEKHLDPVTFVGIHASRSTDNASNVLMCRLLDTPERLGIRTKEMTVYNEEGKLDEERIREVVEQIKKADGFVITTHTKQGVLNSHLTTLLEALETEKLAGKLVAFSHTFSDEDKDSQTGPTRLIQRFFQNKGCIILPYSLMYAHSGDANEPWLERDFERNGVNFVKTLARLGKSKLPELLEDPSVLEIRKTGGEISQAWLELRDRVAYINKERTAKGEKPLNVLFVLGGENPTGYSARTAKALEKNFQFLGLETDTLHLAQAEQAIQPSSGNPEVTLKEVMPEKEGEYKEEDKSMQKAYEKLVQADIVIFTSPVRWFDVSSRLQRFLERMTPMEASGFLLEGKAFGTLVTFGEADAVDAESRLQIFASHNGMMSIPLGGVRIRLSFDPKGKEDPKSRDFLDSKRYKTIRRMAALGTALTTELLAADGKDVGKIRWDHLNPLLAVLSPED